MSNPTTPFSWQMPTATDLVTDLPADFEVFGQAVATSMADLLGGTSGQILAKNSNTDMDFVWIANDQGDITGVTAGTGITVTDPTGPVPTVTNAMATAITTAGDTLYGTGSGTFSRLGIGSTGQVLTVAAGVPSWATASSGSTNVAGKNTILNSAMNVWQRGTTITCSATAYGADRWQAYRTVAGATVSRQVTGDTTNLPEIQYCQRVQRDLANTSTTQIFIAQSMETINSIPMVGKTVTISFYARAGANYSSASNALGYRVVFGTGTDQNVLTSYTGANNFINQTATLTTTWQRFSYSAAVSTTATELGVYFFNTPVGTALTNDYYEITGVQLEIASSASAYSPNAATFQGELAACQRYYYKVGANGISGCSLGAVGVWYSSTRAQVSTNNPVVMRTTPSVSISGAAIYQANGSRATVSAFQNNGYSTTSLNIDVTSTGGVAGNGTILAEFSSGNGYLEASAEL